MVFGTEKVTIPHIIKYMGSKKQIYDFVIPAIREIHNTELPVCDLFAGSCSISAALRKEFDFWSNDIQDYSRVIAHTYFSDLSRYDAKSLINEIEVQAKAHVNSLIAGRQELVFNYYVGITVDQYQETEQRQRGLMKEGVFYQDFHLFTKYYSGTYWSFEQCVWIDAMRKVAEEWTDTPLYNAILASIMYGMSYTTQSTGHFAQYRDGLLQDAVDNIVTYRQKSLPELFKKKLFELIETLDNALAHLETTTLDFEECLSLLPEGSTVYADPPYAPVHYSRFYHALETLVKYDYPELGYKGRYRQDRHQSPFSQKSAAEGAFANLFQGIINRNCQMVLSYSDSAVVKIERVIEIATQLFLPDMYTLEIRTLDYTHSTMGRAEDHERDVIEYMIIAKYR